MLIDTHAHLNDESYNGIRDEILNSALKEMKLIINPGVDLKSSVEGIKIAEKYNIVYAAVGYHPHESKFATEEKLNNLVKLTSYKKVVAIGEIGLDYHYQYSTKEVQKRVFERQIKMAKELKLPIIVHSRDAHKDTYEILERNSENLKAVLHSFSGSWEMAKKYLDLGFYISFSGTVTFKNARKVKEVARKVPLDKVLIETDSPYLTPEPYRGTVNSPLYVKYVAKQVSELKEVPTTDLLIQVHNNAKKLFDRIDLN